MLSFLKSSLKSDDDRNSNHEDTVEVAADAYYDEQAQEWRDQAYDIIRCDFELYRFLLIFRLSLNSCMHTGR